MSIEFKNGSKRKTVFQIKHGKINFDKDAAYFEKDYDNMVKNHITPHQLIYYSHRYVTSKKYTLSQLNELRDFEKIFDTSNKSKIYRVEGSDYPVWKKLLIYCEQKDEHSLMNVFKSESLCFKNMNKLYYEIYYSYFKKWTERRIESVLTKQLIQNIFLQPILNDCMVPPVDSNKLIYEGLDKWMNIILRQNITFLRKNDQICNEELIEGIWTFTKNKLTTNFRIKFSLEWNEELKSTDVQNIKSSRPSINKYFVKGVNFSLKNVYWYSWLENEVPLILKCVDKNTLTLLEKIFSLFEDFFQSKCVIVFSEYNIKTALKTFYKIPDLDNDIIKEIYKTIQISLHGRKPIFVKDIIKKSDFLEIGKHYTSTDCFRFLTKIINIGEDIGKLEHYIKRRLRYKLVHPQSFFQNTPDFYFIFGENLKDNQNYFNSLTYDNFKSLIKNINNNYHTQKTIHKIEAGLNKIKNTLKKWTSQSHTYHLIQIHDDKLFHIYSSNSVNNILFNEYPIDEDYFNIAIISNPVILCNESGMGKSYLLKKMTERYPKDYWIQYIDFEDEKCKTAFTTSTSVKELISKIYRLNNLTDRISEFIFHDRKDNGKLVCMLDSFEIIVNNCDQKLIKGLLNERIIIWIASRPHSKDTLENIFNVKCLELLFFDLNEIVQFISPINVDHNIILKLEKMNPLHIKMNFDLWNDNSSFIFCDDILYEKFIQLNLFVNKVNWITNECFIDIISLFALKNFFKTSFLDRISNFRENKGIMKTLKQHNVRNKIITINKKVTFCHNSYAEFLAARWLAHHISELKNDNILEGVITKLYYPELESIRIFFDKIVCKTRKTHYYLLNNLDLRNEDMKTDEVDVLGRTPLELVASYGDQFSLNEELQGIPKENRKSIVKTKYKCDLFYIQPKVFITQMNINEESVRYLLATRSEIEYDKLMKTCLKTGNLSMMDRIIKRTEHKKYENSKRSNEFKILLYYSVVFNFPNLFNYLDINFENRKIFFDNLTVSWKNIRYFIDNRFDSAVGCIRDANLKFSLLHFAIKNNNIDMVEALHRHTKEYYSKNSETCISPLELTVNQNKFNIFKILFNTYKYDTVYHPLILAVFLERKDFVEYMLFKSVNLKKCLTIHEMLSNIPIIHSNMIEELIRYGLNIHYKFKNKFTILHLALIYGRLDLVKKLLEIGINMDKEDRIECKKILRKRSQNPTKWLKKLHNNFVKIIKEDGNNKNVYQVFINYIIYLWTSKYCKFVIIVLALLLLMFFLFCIIILVKFYI